VAAGHGLARRARRAWLQATAWQGPGAACGRKASAGASRPAGPGYGLREIQGRESSGGAASIINMDRIRSVVILGPGNKDATDLVCGDIQA